MMLPNVIFSASARRQDVSDAAQTDRLRLAGR